MDVMLFSYYLLSHFPVPVLFLVLLILRSNTVASVECYIDTQTEQELASGSSP
jgi:hypothetical protein